MLETLKNLIVTKIMFTSVIDDVLLEDKKFTVNTKADLNH
jgi:hypothetical protein